ncbi:MAG: MucB/RseB C-terminal domain-containing protein [Pseudomonadales bacterium]|nr:MucB/RseB C-terminal domain-containing protein [Pseudomonadales bacterium]
MKQVKGVFGVLVCIALFQSLPVVGETENAGGVEQKVAAQWLQKMVKAIKTESYQGRSIFHNGNRMMSLKVIHGMIDGEQWDRVVHLSGEPAEVLRKGDKISCLHPESTVELSAEKSELEAAKIPLLNAFNDGKLAIPDRYQLRMGREGRVAGRVVQLINIIPVDRARYGYQLGLDKSTGLLLKTVMLNQKGKALEVFEFVDITVGEALSKEDFAPGKGVKWLETADAGLSKEGMDSNDSNESNDVSDSVVSPTVQKIGWAAKWLPQGFNLAENSIRNIDGVSVNTQVYSDGLAAFTIFMEKLDRVENIEGSKQRGATVALSRRLAKPNDHFLVTVVGEVPMGTAMQVAASVVKD